MALHKVKRKVAGHLFIHLFFAQNAITHALTRVTAPGPHDDALGAGLSHKETVLVRDLATRLHKEGEIMRKMGQRLKREI